MELWSENTLKNSTSDQNVTYSNYNTIFAEMGQFLARQHFACKKAHDTSASGASLRASCRTQGSQNRDSCGSRGSQNLASGRGPRASCRGQKIRPVVPDLVLLVEVPKSSPRCGGLPGPLRGSHFDGAVVTVVLRVGRDLVLSARVRGHVGVTSPSPCPEK